MALATEWAVTSGTERAVTPRNWGEVAGGITLGELAGEQAGEMGGVMTKLVKALDACELALALSADGVGLARLDDVLGTEGRTGMVTAVSERASTRVLCTLAW